MIYELLKLINLLKKIRSICVTTMKFISSWETGELIRGNISTNFLPPDFIFIPAGVEYRFINFTNNFPQEFFLMGPKRVKVKPVLN